MINRVLILSYYNPWISGGGHRPVCLLEQELAKGRNVLFLFESDAEMDLMINYGLFNDRNLFLAKRNPETGESSPCNAQAKALLGEGLKDNELILCWSPDYVRSHNPVKSYIPLLKLCKENDIPHVYDQMDYWDGFAVKPWGDKTEKIYFNYSEESITISNWLAKHTKTDKTLHVIPNGVKNHFLEQIRLKDSDDVVQRNNQDKKIILYSGAIWPDWFDWDIVKYIVNKRPEYNFVFVGAYSPTLDEDDGRHVNRIIKELSKLDNVSFLGQVQHHELIPILQKAHIGIIPFVVNKVTEACSPLKCFEYLSAYLPVISTNLPEIKDYPMVTLVNNKEAFLEELDKMLSLEITSDIIDQIEHFLIKSTWKMRSDEFDKVAINAIYKCKNRFNSSIQETSLVSN
ncbi:MAG: hypothetical protein K0S01_1959 [Herbinix sp.]|jgi:glycosyltransferase involved in cell wall biosynthesis|nr:hypothetical protein [Herbinix sp.]